MTAVSEQPKGGASETLPADAPTIAETSRDDLSRMVQEHQAGLWRYLRYLGADSNEADDLVQETFLSVARTAKSGKAFEERSDSQTASYLRTAARNQLLMLRRRQRRQVSTVEMEAAESVWATLHPDGAQGRWEEFLESLNDCVGKLEGRSREVIELQYRQGASRSTIAERLGMKPDGVKTLLRRTRQLLRECVERGVTSERQASPYQENGQVTKES